MLRDTALHATVQRVCADRGIQPAADSPAAAHVDRVAFRRRQVAAVVHHRWAGRYDRAHPDPAVAAWIRQHRSDPDRHTALFLNGGTGSGKTHNAVAVLRELAVADPQLHWAATTHSDLGDELRPRSDGSHEGALDPYLGADLLLLDDLGAGLSTPWTVDCVQRLVDRRWTRRLATIYTTNLPAEQLRAAVGDRVFSRLGDATHVNLGATDRRWQR